MQPLIRLARPADLDAVRDVVREAYAPYIERMGREPGPMLDDYAARIAQRHLYVAERDGAILGILVLVPETQAMLLDNVAVAERARGLGVGRALLAHAESAARDAGLASIRLYTNEAMHENIALYRRIGYVETHRAAAGSLHRVYMSKPLAPG